MPTRMGYTLIVRILPTGRFQTSASEHKSVDPLRRKSRRSAVAGEVMLRRSGQGSYRVKLCDLSPSGCKLEFVERPFLREAVWVKFDEMEALEASVCWVEGFAAGVEFRKAMHPAVFEHLTRKLRRSQQR